MLTFVFCLLKQKEDCTSVYNHKPQQKNFKSYTFDSTFCPAGCKDGLMARTVILAAEPPMCLSSIIPCFNKQISPSTLNMKQSTTLHKNKIWASICEENWSTRSTKDTCDSLSRCISLKCSQTNYFHGIKLFWKINKKISKMVA